MTLGITHTQGCIGTRHTLAPPHSHLTVREGGGWWDLSRGTRDRIHFNFDRQEEYTASEAGTPSPNDVNEPAVALAEITAGPLRIKAVSG